MTKRTRSTAGVQLEAARQWHTIVVVDLNLMGKVITMRESEGWRFWDVKPIGAGYLLLFWRFPEAARDDAADEQ